MTYIKKVILQSTNDSGTPVNIPGDSYGHMEVAIHSPKLPFDSIHTEKLLPVFQTDAVYGINSGLVNTTSSGTGSATTDDSSFSVSTGTTSLSFATIQSRKRLRYRAGQGVIRRFAGFFTTPVANSYQLIGFGHADDGVYFGYGDTNNLSNTEFGILYVNRGVREVRTLTITTASTTAQNITITLNGTANTIAVTNSNNIQRTVYEIATGSYTGWTAYPSGATIVFVRNTAGTASGTYSITATTAAGSFAQTKAGAASTDLFIPQSSWNGDKLDGTGPSGVTIDPTKGNVFEIGIQYLGYGDIEFKVEVVSSSGDNNATFVTVHTLTFPNTRTKTTFSNPSFPFTMATYSAGSTTNLTVKVGSFAGFIEGEKVLHGNRFSYFNSSTSVSSSAYLPLFTVLNSLYYGGRANQAVVNLLSIAAALKHTNPCVIYVIKNGTLSGNPNFASFASNSCTLIDTAATAVTFSTNDQLLWSGHMGDTGQILFEFSQGVQEITLQPGEYLTIAAKSLGAGSPNFVTASLNTREDQ